MSKLKCWDAAEGRGLLAGPSWAELLGGPWRAAGGPARTRRGAKRFCLWAIQWPLNGPIGAAVAVSGHVSSHSPPLGANGPPPGPPPGSVLPTWTRWEGGGGRRPSLLLRRRRRCQVPALPGPRPPLAASNLLAQQCLGWASPLAEQEQEQTPNGAWSGQGEPRRERGASPPASVTETAIGEI